MNLHSLYSGVSEPVETCVVGTGGFGQSFVSHARRVRLLRARIAVDTTAEGAALAFRRAGVENREIAVCTTRSEAKDAWAAGKAVAAGSLDTVIDLPFELLIEATGHPEYAAIHALRAIESARHVALVSKEADSVVGPGLAHLARQNGRLVTPVDGDQPSLLINLISWAEVLGFDIMAAGKSSEYDFVVDRRNGAVTSNGVTATLPALLQHWVPGDGTVAASQGRNEALGQRFPLRTVPDLCELTIVANATEFVPDRPDLHAPAARIPEVADLFAPREASGLLAGARRLDVFHHLRAPDEASFAGGVFIVVRCNDRDSWRMLAEKGHAVGSGDRYATLYLPRHLLGLEAATSVLDAARLGKSGYGDDYKPRIDLTAVADRDLAAGDYLVMGGHHHSIDGVSGRMTPARPLAEDAPVPFYLASNRRLARNVRAGDAILMRDLEFDDASPLVQLRRRQDAVFFA